MSEISTNINSDNMMKKSISNHIFHQDSELIRNENNNRIRVKNQDKKNSLKHNTMIQS